ncbi:hypothetical protein LMG18101_03298 [Ralstonia flaminis]|uniref:Uncharacterized protein n=3 Tax=Ralstonia TaxID=48736 RepID=A0ABN9KEF3_9RALS|nr:hypothetical protein R38712_03104 [Ralstonia pickettii]CAJ0817524.1 hypothetical protein LMG18101_03298 [Ralstonia sp. LMG 18101]CAJ0889865.1 hypothetical protein R77564_03411 [Ralstonia sp. LMG 32965]SCW89720.1 hypothetical protein SAMN02799637_03245 [Ralstonia sp. UNCCL144]
MFNQAAIRGGFCALRILGTYPNRAHASGSTGSGLVRPASRFTNTPLYCSVPVRNNVQSKLKACTAIAWLMTSDCLRSASSIEQDGAVSFASRFGSISSGNRSPT